MPLFTVNNVHHSYGSRVILEGATLAIDPDEKVGLVGRNGSGKTTLMKIIRGDLTPDSGSVQVSRGARVGYLTQDPSLPPDETLRGAAEAAFAELHALHQRMEDIYEEMASAEGNALDKLMRQQVRIEGEIEAAGGYAIDHKIDAMLHGLGFRDDQFSLKVNMLSGGQKGRLGLARLLLEEPDLLLLDEPTNHLDIVGRQWLEQFLADEYHGAVIVVSHDRWLLDRVVHRIIEVERGELWDYPGNYEKYRELRRERQLTQARVFDKQMDKIRREEQFIRKYKAGQRAKQARGRESRLDRFKKDQLVERPIELDVMNLSLPKSQRSGDVVVSIENISKRYGDLALFEDLSLSLKRGDRLGIIGPNGAGKTTLVKCLLGELTPDEGTVRLGSRLSIGYYRQSHEHIDLSLPVYKYLQTVIASLDGGAMVTEQQARDLAGAFLFSGLEQEKALGDVSGGERSRAVLAGLVAGAHNLLVLDEPTNHLDIPSAERLEQSLAPNGAYDGTLILITHDRALLQSTCNQLLILDGKGNVRHFLGTYRDWEERQQRETEGAAQAAAQQKSAAAAIAKQHRHQHQHEQVKGAGAATAVAPSKKGARAGGGANLSFAGNNPALVKLSFTKLEQRIEEIESRIKAIDAQMLKPDVYTNGEKCRALQTERATLLAQRIPLEEEWSRRAEG